MVNFIFLRLSLQTVPEKTVNKFYLTLALYDLWNGMQVFEVADKFQVYLSNVNYVRAISYTDNILRLIVALFRI